MNTVKAICTATTLALALSIPAYAGDIASPGLKASGELGTPGVSAPGDTGSPGASEIALPAFADMLMNLLSMLP